ncbi:hypothetical protein VTN96DRAFT_1641 [Rasamsonia emersonii]|uniref:Uncharacterized protein n=1 Tax=Rasamsonia emersonii (strain ATCC 16479 / CBS 393.64 / IMI 116815) TaxID=1408163 RepID=A0A0F4YZ86_RASE3|nr:hypothetical protein T310_2583 [Rasamsonia emersonii CBS 393.64]KKA23410.1 hypothetical protein T310_2583 [Rasamsonia emersonii CBS 393.64]
MAATLSGTFSSAPDTPSPVYPDRLIRPLPKRPLRSRLSPEAAESILYPPAPPATQLFYGSYSENGEAQDGKTYTQQNSAENYGQDQSPDRDHRHPYENGVEVESGDEDGPVVVRRSAGFRGSSLSPSTPTSNGQTQSNNPDSSQTKSSPAGMDGYDAFENTNNKKKRKIPTSGSLSSHHSSLTADLANMGISGLSSSSPSALGDGGGTGTYYGSGSPASASSSGISGPGRGRLGRHSLRSSGRNPLSTIHSPNSWLGGRSAGSRRDLSLSSQGATGDSGNKSDQGIISAAIANAAALSPTSKGQDNVSLLDQQNSKTSPTKTQFTFTCESDLSKSIALQPPNPYPLPQQQRLQNQSLPPTTTSTNQRDFATQGTQTSPSMGSGNSQQTQQSGPQPPAAGTQNNAPPKKPKRSASSIYALAARQRKIQQQYTNLHHPPNPEDIWICEFCEYEAIFGHPPEALIRQYEIKDRKERRRLAEKRRLLEKAKMKGRKSKKATKNAAKHAAAQQPAHHPAEHAAVDASGSHPDDYLGTEYDDESSPVPPPAPPQQTPTKQSAPAGTAARTSSAAGTAPSKGVGGGGGSGKAT